MKAPKFTILSLFILLTIEAHPQTASFDHNALHFDGINDYIDLNNIGRHLHNKDSFTIEFEMIADMNDQSPITNVSLFSVNQAAPGSNELLLTMGGATKQDGKLRVFDNNGSSLGKFELESSQTIGDNKCHHIAYVKTGNVGEVFIDGVSAGTHDVGYVIDSTKRFSFGQDWDAYDTSDFIKATISELRIWDVARTKSELTNNRYTRFGNSEKNLIIYYDFDQGVANSNNQSVNQLIDRSSNSAIGYLRNFTLNGPSSNWVGDICNQTKPTRNNNALHFDGVDDYVDLSNIARYMHNRDSFTIEFEMIANSNQQNRGANVSLFSVNQAAPGSNELLLTMGGKTKQDGKLRVFDNNGSSTGAFELESKQAIGDEKCHHIAYVKSGNVGEIFVDGISEGTHKVGYTIDSTKRFSFGQDWDAYDTSDFVKASISELRIWDKARTQAELVSHRNSRFDKSEKHLIIYYDFEQGVAGSDNSTIRQLVDRSYNCANGELRNFTLNGLTSNWIDNKCGTVATVKNSQELLIAKIYPNPVDHILTVDLDKIQRAQLYVLGLRGEVLISKELRGSSQTTLNVQNLNPGIYLIKIEGQRISSTYKFVKQ